MSPVSILSGCNTPIIPVYINSGTVPAKVKVRTKKRTPFFQELPDGRLIHEQYEVVKLEQGFKCVTCGTICKDRVNIQGHIKRVHLNDLAGI